MRAEKLLGQIIEYFEFEVARINEKMIHFGDFSGLTFAQIGYLEVIARLGHPSITELAFTLKISKPSVTVAVQKLCAGGYLKKVNSCSDKRSWRIYLNTRGQRFLEAHMECHASAAKTVAGAFKGREKKQLVEMLEKIVAHINIERQKTGGK
ncbi:MAG: MarR family winged helix-turn-helix transcriptional regulator [Candidatus Firestonebacteria bacterium]